jgi:ribosomal protein S18 acetylase RimI-like enzyme
MRTMPSPFTLEPAQADDLPHIVALKLAMFEECGHADLLATDAAERVLSDYQTLYARSEAQHFLARSGAQIVAMAGAFIKSEVPFRYFRVPITGFIGDVYSEPEFRRCGLALALNRHAIDWLAAKGIETVRLLASHSGRPIYEKLGFAHSDEMTLDLTRSHDLR